MTNDKLDPRSKDVLEGTDADEARAAIIERRKAEADAHAEDPVERMLRAYDPALPRNLRSVPAEGASDA